MANQSLCTVDGCSSKYYGLGYCFAHYRRFKRHGDPLAGGIRYGAAQKFVVDTLKADPVGDCIPWPYGKNARGVGRINWRGYPSNVDAVICEQAHGPKPSPKHECCNKCGNGHQGCVNPQHLYWGTRTDNVRDAIRHGTFHFFQTKYGEEAPAAKYSDSCIAEVKKAILSGEKQVVVAKRFGISQSHVSRIKNGVRSARFR